jgi:hypothetical protein
MKSATNELKTCELSLPPLVVGSAAHEAEKMEWQKAYGFVCVQWFEHHNGVGYASRRIASDVELIPGRAVRVGLYKLFRQNLKFNYLASK